MDAMNPIGGGGVSGPKSVQQEEIGVPSGESEQGSGDSQPGAINSFGRTLAKISQAEQKEKIASDEARVNDLDAGIAPTSDGVAGLVVAVPLLLPLIAAVANQEQDPGQGLAQDVTLPALLDGVAAATDIPAIAQSASPDAVESGKPALSAVLQGTGSGDFLGKETQMPSPDAQPSEVHLSDIVLRSDAVAQQVAAEPVLGEVATGDMAASAVPKPDQKPDQVLSVHQAASESPQFGIGQSTPVSNRQEETPGAGQGFDYVVQALSKEAPQSAAGDQFLERDRGEGTQERRASQGGDEVVMGAPFNLDLSAHGAEILARPAEPAFRSELTMAAERAVPVPAEGPAAVVPNTGGTMRLQFEPTDLGRVTVQVSVQAQQVHATVSVQHEGLGQFLTTSQGALDDAMRQHGLRVEEFRVDLDAGQAGQGQLFGEHLPGFQDREGGRSTGTAKGFESLPIETSNEGSSLTRYAHRINLFA